MSDIITSYQEEQQIPRPEPQSAKLATVKSVGVSGLSVQFDGETSYDQVQYVCNTGQVFKYGDRVLVQKVGGSYVIVCAIGKPTREINAENANTANYVENHAVGYADLEFYYDTRGTLWFRNIMDADNKWTKLTGTTGRPPREFD